MLEELKQNIHLCI